MSKKIVVIHSGGMDSSVCLALAIKEFGVKNVLSLSFSYQQRNSNELVCAKKICKAWNVNHQIITLDFYRQVTTNALLDHSIAIQDEKGEQPPNTLVMGRNGLMAHLGGIYAHQMGSSCIMMGVIEVEQANPGYRDCSRRYMDLKQETLRIDLNDPNFEIQTPLVYMTKAQIMKLADELNVLEFLLENTITCYEGIPREGCQRCPACLLRNEGIREYQNT